MTPLELLAGAPVWLGGEMPELPATGAREHGLNALADYLASLTYRVKSPDGSRAVNVPRSRIHVFQPDDFEAAELPGIAILPGQYDHDYYGLGGPQILEETRDQFGEGSVLVRTSDYVETVIIDIASVHYPHGRGVAEGIKAALRMMADTSALRLKCLDYYDQIAIFSTVPGAGYLLDPDVVRSRRHVQIPLLMRVPELYRVQYAEMKVEITTEVYDGNSWLDFGVTPFP